MFFIIVQRLLLSKRYVPPNLKTLIASSMSTALQEASSDAVETADVGCGVKRKAEEPITGLDIKKASSQYLTLCDSGEKPVFHFTSRGCCSKMSRFVRCKCFK